MNRQKEGVDKQREKHCYAGSKSGTSDTSVYSTCSNGQTSSTSSSNGNDLIVSVQSVVLAGKCMPNAKAADVTLEESFFPNETNYSISPLDLNLDVLSENNDVFMDCTDASNSDARCDSTKRNSKSSSNRDESTQYIQCEAMLRVCKENDRKCNYPTDKNVIEARKEKDPNRLITIVEESEITRMTNSLISKNSSPSSVNNTGKYLVDLANKMKDCNKVSTKRVLFANEDDVPEVDERSANKLKCVQKTPKPLVGKNQFCARSRKGTDENSNNHNTTESFVMWEKYCQDSERLDSRRSLSFSELNTTESYDGDNEFSGTFKSIGTEYFSRCSIELTEENRISRKRTIRRSKSCDSFLKEVKHLPHVLYDKFLKCLANEIDSMRKQKVYCTCEKVVKKPQSRENVGKTIKNNAKNPNLKVTNVGNKKENKLSPKTASLDPIRNRIRVSPGISKDVHQSHTRSRLSPEICRDVSHQKNRLSPDVLKESSRFNNAQRLSPKSPNKTPTTPTMKQKLCWQKEIISPVGEYIRGKRPSPYRSSPSKRM